MGADGALQTDNANDDNWINVNLSVIGVSAMRNQKKKKNITPFSLTIQANNSTENIPGKIFLTYVKAESIPHPCTAECMKIETVKW